jgi:hypothetical protein
MRTNVFEKDFTVATPEEFVKKFGGNKVINKVCSNKFIYNIYFNVI